jgi:hypothetical protein
MRLCAVLIPVDGHRDKTEMPGGPKKNAAAKH